MSTLVTNECGVQTILPMGVVCNVTDSSIPTSLDGAIYLTITGGSVPYSVTWSNGSKSQNLYSISAGTYTATVVDYYGDYTATTTCTVGSEQFYVDWFNSCYDNSINLYLTGLTETLTQELIYRLSGNTGCWVYSGKTLNGSNTLTFDNILEGPFDTCLECDPPIVLPYYPEQLCLLTANPYTTYQFEFYGFANERPAYTGTSTNSSGFTIQWVTGATNQWQVLNKTDNTLINPNDTFNPLGGWVLQGTQQIWTAVSGACPTIPELTATVSTNNFGCESDCNGIAVITATGGLPPYQYSFDGGPYGSLPSKTNLCAGGHTYSVTDFIGNNISGTYIVPKGLKNVTYTVTLITNQIDTQTNYGFQVDSKLEYKLEVTPELPEGVEISIPFQINVRKLISTPGQTDISYTSTLYSGGTVITPETNSLTNTNIREFPWFESRHPWTDTTQTYAIIYRPLVLKKGLTISGTVNTSIVKISDGLSQNCAGSRNVTNPYNNTRSFLFTNCTGGTTTGIVNPGESIDFCQKGAIPSGVILTPVSNLELRPGNMNCSNITNGNIRVGVAPISAGLINSSCGTLRIIGAGEFQLYSQLYRP
jgi:hypothetical protein